MGIYINRGNADFQRILNSEYVDKTADVPAEDGDDLMALLLRIVLKTQKHFFFIIDEWDAICREFPAGSKGMDSYVNWLRRLFKSVNANTAFAGAYMTGILPIMWASATTARPSSMPVG